MNTLFAAAAVLGLLLAGLALERTRLGRLRRRVPLRICVTGIRGKSTVVRLVAGALRASGRRVVAKTTGSRPAVILPGGEEREIFRSGPPSILEQKKLLALAAKSGADAVVVEMMGIRPEVLAVESGRILQPGILVVTNVRIDHRPEMGTTPDAIAASLAAAVSPGCVVLIPEEEWFPVFDEAAAARGAQVVKVPAAESSFGAAVEGIAGMLPENVRLALAVAGRLGLDREASLRGLAEAPPDLGGLRAWTISSPRDGRPWRFASVFAANEPASTRRSLEYMAGRIPGLPARRIGLLNMRADRPDRTRQWLEAVRDGFFEGFAEILFVGEQAQALERAGRRLGRAVPAFGVVRGRKPERIMSALWESAEEETLVVGMGNIAGAGRALVEHWNSIGERLL